MQIDYTEDLKTLKLSSLAWGDCFMYGSCIFMKTDEKVYSACKCVNLGTGVITMLKDNVDVFCIDAKLCAKRIFNDTDK